MGARREGVVESRGRAGARRLAAGLALVLVVCSLSLRLLGAWRGVPVLSGDQLAFLPVAREWVTHLRFAHPFWHFPGAGSSLYNWHGWLFPIVLAWFPTSRGAQTILFGATAIALISVGTFVVYARVARLGAVERATLLVVVSAIAVYQIGRPESLLTGLWGAALVLERRLRGHRFDAAAALLLGAAIVTQPVVSSAAFLAFVMYAGCARDGLRSVALSAASVGGAALVVAAALTTVCSPLPLDTWYEGLRANAAYVSHRSDGGSAALVSYLVLQPGLLLGGSYVAMAALVAGEACARPRTLGLRCATAGAAALLALYILLMALRVPATVYNLVALGPLIAAVSLRWAHRPRLRPVVAVTALAAAASLALGAFSVVAALGGTPIDELRSTLRARQPCVIAADASSWLAVADAIGDGHLCGEGQACPSRIILQANSGLLVPPAQLGEQRLVADHFHPGPLSVLGVGVGRTRKDYAFALYGDLSRCAD